MSDDGFIPDGQGTSNDGFVPDSNHTSRMLSIVPKMAVEGLRDTALRMGRPALEYGGLAVGAAAGAPGGLPTAIAGGGLGYAAGKQAGNILGQTLGNEPVPPLADQMINTAKDVWRGAEYEAGGRALGAVAETAAPLLGRGGSAIKKGWSKVGEALTGKSAQKVSRLIEDPSVILPEFLGGAKSVPEASVDYGQALGKSELTKPEFDPFAGDAKAKEMGSLTWQRWKSGTGEPIDPQEAYDGIQATKYAMPAAITERNVEKVRELMQFKDAMENILTEQKGPLMEASKGYGRAKLKEDFSQWFPRTQTGKISQVKSLMMPSFIDPARAWMLGLTSPKVFGAATAAASGMAGLTKEMLAQPAMKSMLMAYISKPSPVPNQVLGQRIQ